MSDSRSPMFFARLFEWLAEDPTARNKAFADEMQKLSMEYDFASCELEVDDAMVALGIAKDRCSAARPLRRG